MLIIACHIVLTFLADCSGGSVTKKQLAPLIRLINNWKRDVLMCPTEDNLKKLEHTESELVNIQVALGGMVETDPFSDRPTLKGKCYIRCLQPSAKRRLGKVKAKALQKLARQEDVTDLMGLIDSHFEAASSIDSISPQLKIKFGEPSEGIDPGTEVESSMDYETLRKHLLLDENGLLRLCNHYRYSGLDDPWSKKAQTALTDFVSSSKNPQLFTSLRLHWHQIAGLHAMVRKFFTSQPDPANVTGSLIADGVGAGKTMMSGATVGFLIELGHRQSKSLPLPPIIGVSLSCTTVRPLIDIYSVSQPYLGASKDIPDLPSIILVPGTLGRQWVRELHVLFKPGFVKVFVYPSSPAARTKFWAKNGPYYSCDVPARNRIIVANQSVSSTEMV